VRIAGIRVPAAHLERVGARLHIKLVPERDLRVVAVVVLSPRQGIDLKLVIQELQVTSPTVAARYENLNSTDLSGGQEQRLLVGSCCRSTGRDRDVEKKVRPVTSQASS